MNFVYLLIVHVLDALTGGSLDYKQPHGRFDSRIDAAFALLEDGAVEPTGAFGYYRVKSEDRTSKKSYYVCALRGDLSCECEDATNTKNNPTNICKHCLAAVVYDAQRQTFAQMDATERSAA